MRLIGNIIWILFGGLELALAWMMTGLLLMITIIGIPLGLQCFKIAALSLYPFGKEIEYRGLGAVSILANILWVIFFGIFLCVANVILGILFSITIIGIPFGIQYFKLARLSLFPFGARIYEI